MELPYQQTPDTIALWKPERVNVQFQFFAGDRFVDYFDLPEPYREGASETNSHETSPKRDAT